MKTALIVLVIVLLAVACVAGQTAHQKSGAFGIKAGLGFGSVQGDGVDWFEQSYTHVQTGHRTGITIGGFATVRLTNSLVFQPEVLYANKGAKWEQGGGSLTGKLAYLEVPLLLKLNIPTGGHLVPNLFGGPYLGMATTSKVTLKVPGYYSGSLDLGDQTKSVDYGMVFGAGTSLRTSHRGAVTFEARYELGLLDINDFDETQYTGYDVPLEFRGEVKTNSLGFLIGYSFR